MKKSIQSLTEGQINEVIGMAWCDKTSFEMIETHMNLSEMQVKWIMKKHLKAGSYRLWRRRVTQNKRKHQLRNNQWHALD